jgi:hypothetical protein
LGGVFAGFDFIAMAFKLIIGLLSRHGRHFMNNNAANLMRGFNSAGRMAMAGVVFGLVAAFLSFAPYV